MRISWATAAILAPCTSLGATPLLPLDELITFRSAQACETGPSYDAIEQSFTHFDRDGNLTLRALRVPRAYRAAFGALHYERRNGWRTVSIPIRAQWLGLPLTEISWSYPDGGDPRTIGFRFAASKEAVIGALNRKGFAIPLKGTREYGDDPPYTAYLSVAGNKRQTEFTCSWG